MQKIKWNLRKWKQCQNLIKVCNVRLTVKFCMHFNVYCIGKLTSKSAGGKKKKGGSVFDSQFTDVSKSGVKKYRYE